MAGEDNNYKAANDFYGLLGNWVKHLFHGPDSYYHRYGLAYGTEHVVVLSMDVLRSVYVGKPIRGDEYFTISIPNNKLSFNVKDSLSKDKIVFDFTSAWEIWECVITSNNNITWHALWEAGTRGEKFIKVMTFNDYLNSDADYNYLNDLSNKKSGSMIDFKSAIGGLFVGKVEYDEKIHILDAGEIKIKTKFGELIVHKNGTYQYGVEKGSVPVGDSCMDSFAVTIQGPDGKTETVPLKIETFGSDRGTAGDDVMSLTGSGKIAYGLGGNDRYVVDEADDAVIEAVGGGYDTLDSRVSYHLAEGQEIEVLRFADPNGTADLDLTGNEFLQMLFGNAGKNRLDGGAGADLMAGGKGDDTYIVDEAGDVVLEMPDEGTDRVDASVSYSLVGTEAEFLFLAGTGHINATGNAHDNILAGNDGNNILDGKAGFDLMAGRAGNDTYIVDDVRDIARERAGEGIDRVITFVSHTLREGSEIERIDLAAATGTKPLKLTGNEFAQTLRGNGGDNTLDGRGGADTMAGGAGNDIYGVDQAGDRVFEATGGGTDRVYSVSSFALAAGQEIELLFLLKSTGMADLNLTGNGFGQTLSGNAGDNVLDGRGGADVLAGGRGADTFVFSTALGNGNVDRIADFSAVDTIRLSAKIFTALAPGQLKAAEFKDIANGKVDADDHILYDSRSGSLFYDADGSGKAAAVKFAVLDNKAAITAADFLVV